MSNDAYYVIRSDEYNEFDAWTTNLLYAHIYNGWLVKSYGDGHIAILESVDDVRTMLNTSIDEISDYLLYPYYNRDNTQMSLYSHKTMIMYAEILDSGFGWNIFMYDRYILTCMDIIGKYIRNTQSVIMSQIIELITLSSNYKRLYDIRCDLGIDEYDGSYDLLDDAEKELCREFKEETSLDVTYNMKQADMVCYQGVYSDTDMMHSFAGLEWMIND